MNTINIKARNQDELCRLISETNHKLISVVYDGEFYTAFLEYAPQESKSFKFRKHP